MMVAAGLDHYFDPARQLPNNFVLRKNHIELDYPEEQKALRNEIVGDVYEKLQLLRSGGTVEKDSIASLQTMLRDYSQVGVVRDALYRGRAEYYQDSREFFLLLMQLADWDSSMHIKLQEYGPGAEIPTVLYHQDTMPEGEAVFLSFEQKMLSSATYFALTILRMKTSSIKPLLS